MQEWILPELNDEVECLVHDLQAEQEQGTQAQVGSSSSTYSSSTYSLKGELGKRSRIFGGWTEKYIGESGAATGGSGAATEGICASFGKRSKTEEEDREARK